VIVLALNSGSSSLKYSLYRVSTGRVEALQEGQLDAVATIAPLHTRASAAACTRHRTVPFPSQADTWVGQVAST
jgi:acetate kinase